MASKIVIDPNQVKLIRKGLFSRIKEDDYDEKDIKRYKTEDAQVARHIRTNSNKQGQELIDETVSSMVDMLEWRAELDVANASDYPFNAETVKFYESFIIEGGTEKKEGSKCLWWRSQRWKDEYFDTIPDSKRYAAYVLEKIDNATFNDKGFTYWMDYSNANLSNISSLEMAKYSIRVLSYYHGGLRYVAAYNPSKIFNSFLSMATMVLPNVTDNCIVVPKEELDKYMDASEVPKEIN